MTLLFIADIIGQPGFELTTALLPNIRKQYRVDLCIANGENGCNGKGLTEKIVRNYNNVGIDVITGGNHSWTVASFRKYLDTTRTVLRPLNYPPGVPGHGSTIVTTPNGVPVGIINLQGRTFMYQIDCPFRMGLSEVEKLKSQTKIIFVDFHAEATAEKAALARYLDGKVSAVVGTHTHVQTADERILENGTAFITDAGMTGPTDSVIGLNTKTALRRFLLQIPERYEIASSNNRLNGVLVEIDAETGKALDIKRLNLP
ncbi:TIGR00282 family metallophosphoesterase [candidate division KSB1 bacterium]|nr:TIGR00282 family metallophosphoesterase [candidate division KSB1 bacterium]